MKILVITLLLMVGCSGIKPVTETEYGKVVQVETEAEVLEVLAKNMDSNTKVVKDDTYTIFIVQIPNVDKNPIVVSSTDMTELNILINQYVDRGWKLKGSVSVSSKLGTLTYFATMVK